MNKIIKMAVIGAALFTVSQAFAQMAPTEFDPFAEPAGFDPFV